MNTKHCPPVDCQQPDPCPDCTPLSGEYTFDGPAKIYSFNSIKPMQVYFEGEPVDVFGGSNPAIKEFDLCGEYRIKWTSLCIPPECNPVEPKFHKACEEEDSSSSASLVCLKQKDSDAQFQGWALTAKSSAGLDIQYFDQSGTEINSENYDVIGESCSETPEQNDTLVELTC